MDEYEKLENDLQKQYDVRYKHKSCNVACDIPTCALSHITCATTHGKVCTQNIHNN